MAEMTSAPIDNLRGITVALMVLCVWGGLTVTLIATPLAMSSLGLVVVFMGVQTWLYTGLFITAHDSMHRTICPRYPWINDALGVFAVGVYALFDFRMLRTAHHAHHAHPATATDPDFHDGQHPHPVRWYIHFLRKYMSIWQVVGMALIFNGLRYGLGVSAQRMVLFWIVPSLLSTLQLFVVGTWLPHRAQPGRDQDRHRAVSLHLRSWLSLLACYHFGYHHEHHARPGVPWWRLPQAHREARAGLH